MISSGKNKKSQDNTEDNLTACELELLSILQTTNALTDLAKKTNRKKPNVHKTAKRLINKGLADNRNGLYFISGYGIQVLKQKGYPETDGDCGGITGIKKPREKIRMHDVSFTIRFWEIPPGWDKIRGTVFGLAETEESELSDHVSEFKNNQSFAGGGLQTLRFKDYMVITYASSIRVFVPEVIADEPEQATIEAWRSLTSFLPKLERWLKIPSQSLYSNRRLNIKISTAHYALFKSAFAQFMIKDRHETRFVVPGYDGKERLLIDRSLNSFETEATTALHGEDDSRIIKQVFQQYIEDEAPMPKAVGDSLDMIGASVVDVNHTLQDFAIHLQAHTGTAKANLEAAKTLNRALDRMDSVLNHPAASRKTESLSDLQRVRKNYLSKIKGS